jgi:HEAT repeat protein
MRSPTRSEKIFVAALAITAGTVSFFALGPLAVDGWLVLRLRSSDENTWRDAAERLIRRGTGFGVRAAMAKALEAEPDRIKEWRGLLADSKDFRARLALPVFRDGLRKERTETRRAALNSLRRPPWRDFPETVSILEEALSSGDPILRWQAAFALGEIGGPARGVVPALIQALCDGEPNVRWAAAWALGWMAPISKEAVPALGRLLADSSDLVSCEAARSLGAFGPLAARETGRLAAALGGPDPARAAAAAALAEIGKGAREAVPGLLAALEKEGTWEEDKDFLCIGQELDSIPPRVIPSIGGTSMHFANSGPSDGRRHAVRALRQLGGIGEARFPLLLKLLGGNSSLRYEVLGALGGMGPAAAPTVPKIVEAIAEGCDPRRLFCTGERGGDAAFEALARIGPPAEPYLLAILREEDGKSGARCGAALALGAMEGSSEAALAALRGLLDDPSIDLRLAAAVALRALGQAIDLVPLILEANRTVPPYPKLNGSWQYAEFPDVGKESLSSLPLVLEALGEEQVRDVALRLLGKIGENSGEAAAVIPPLLEALDSPEEYIRLIAAKSLQDVATGSAEAARRVTHELKARLAVPKDARTVILDALCRIAPEDPEVFELAFEEPEGWGWRPAVLFDQLLELERIPKISEEKLLPAFSGKIREVRIKAARILLRLGSQSPEILPVLREGLRNNFRILMIGDDNELLLDCQCDIVRREAARGIAGMGPAAREAAPDLEECLGSKDHVLRVLAASARWKVSRDARLDVLIDGLDGVRDAPIDLYGTREWLPEPLQVAKEAAAVLAEIGSPAAAALPALERAIADPASRPIRPTLEAAAARIRSPHNQ